MAESVGLLVSNAVTLDSIAPLLATVGRFHPHWGDDVMLVEIGEAPVFISLLRIPFDPDEWGGHSAHAVTSKAGFDPRQSVTLSIRYHEVVAVKPVLLAVLSEIPAIVDNDFGTIATGDDFRQ